MAELKLTSRSQKRPLRTCLCALSFFFPLLVPRAETAPELRSAWPQAYTVKRDAAGGVLTLSTPYYTIQHDLNHGGIISSIRLTHGRNTNLLVEPIETRVRDAAGTVYSEMAQGASRVTTHRDGLNEVVTVRSPLRSPDSSRAPIRVKTVYEYHWGFIKIHKELTFARDFRVLEICPFSTMLAPSLAAYGYRDGRTEAEGADPFSFNSCHWGKLTAESGSGVETSYLPRYVMLADPGVEGLEWFQSSDLAQWDLQVTGHRGQGKYVLQCDARTPGIRVSVSAFQSSQSPARVPRVLSYDYYIGLPLLEGHALKPWFNESFNRNRGNWVSKDQIRQWVENGVQTVHCHNDGDYYGDGLFWHDGAYPPYPDMDEFDKVIADCHAAGIRVATYFSNKELHPSTPQFQEHGMEWARMDSKGRIQHNAFNDRAEFGAQMCLHSGWLQGLEADIDRVLSHHALDGVYYDWNVALLCYNPKHERLKPGQAAAGHWDIDELLELMEWTRHRVGPRGLVIVHDTGTPMFATENFADHVVAHEWGYPKWTGEGPGLPQLPLEWSLVGARPRGVISYGMIGSGGPPHLHRLFALEALLSGVTPWPADAATFALFPVLKPIGDIDECRFADWRNQASTIKGSRAGCAIYSRPTESWLVVGNLRATTQKVRCVLRPDKLPYPLPSLGTATWLPSGLGSTNAAPVALDPKELSGNGVELTIGPEGAVLVHVQ